MRKTIKSKFVGACVSERGAVRPINQDSILFKLLKGYCYRSDIRWSRRT